MKHALWMHFTFLILFASPLVADDKQAAAVQLTYEQHIRPVFKANCFQCHGEESEHEAELDLRLRKLVLKGGESGAAIVPGDSEKSLLVERIRSGEMPPGKTKISPQQIEMIARWISQGAKTARPEPDSIDSETFTAEELNFWSLRPLQRPQLPAVKQSDRVRTPVDVLLLSKLEQQGLEFSADADKQTLIRRACFDLLGLPPTPQQIREFIADDSPIAYERMIERLLASPRYGERWGRHWLDVAGYADSEGYAEADPERDSAFRYRDYVIRSFNADKPFDQFIQEQLAGDELVEPPYKNLTSIEIEKLTATGFLRMAPDGTGTGGVDQSIARNQVMADTIKIVSTSLLGMTVGCAQCHDHRYDPISHADYYRMRAIFEPSYNWKQWRPPVARRISLYTDEDRKLADEIEAKAKLVDDERKQKTQEFIDITLENQLLKVPEELRDPLRVAYKTPVAERTEQQKNLLDEYPKVLKISAGSLYLYDREIRTDAAKIDNERTKKQAEFVEQAFAVALAKLPAEMQPLARDAKNTTLQKRTEQQKQLLIEHPDILVAADTLAMFAPDLAKELQKLKKAAADLRATQKANQIEDFQKRAATIRAGKPTEGFLRVLTEVPGQSPDTFLFYRGDHEQPKQKLAPAGLTVLAKQDLGEVSVNDTELPSTGRRLSFARRLTSGRHPLTARVLVNRIWLHHFGRGIVETPGDFGALGARPTHPQLLDWLADEFVSSGWQMKKLHSLIITSTAYRQSSLRTAELDAIDPDNRLYGRMNVRRLEAEILRDSILAISGNLSNKLFGPPVPVMEDEVGQIVIGKENLDGERKPGSEIPLHGEQFRRSLYVQVRRSRPLAVLDTFDSPAMQPNCELRTASTVAPQALMLMNSQFSVQFSQLFAERVQRLVGDDPQAQALTAWTLAFGREPTAAQIDAAVGHLVQQAKHYRENRPLGIEMKPEILALASYCQALVSSNRFLYVD